MKKILSVIIGISFTGMTYGQEMPSVFNKSLSGNGNQLKKIEPLDNGDLLVIGGGASKSYFARLSAEGKIIFEKKNAKDAAICYNDMVLAKDGSILAVGGGTRSNGAGRISLFSGKGELIFDKLFGSTSGGFFTKAQQDNAGNFIVVGLDGSSPSRARILKINTKGEILFDKLYAESTIFNDLEIEDDDSYIAIGGDLGDNRGKGLIVKLTSKGDKVYEISSGSGGASYTKGYIMDDGSLLAIGGGVYGTGNPSRATRVRVDGQVIFDKTYSVVDSRFSAMEIDGQGQIILAAQEFDRGRILKLRPDGTIIFNKETTTPIVDFKVNSVNQIIAAGTKEGASSVLKLSPNGKIIFDVPVPEVSLKNLLLSEDGKIYVTSSKSCRMLKFDDMNGDLLFDKEYGKSDSEACFTGIYNLPSGEIIAIGGGKGDGNRITKISHGASINDITFGEPLNGTSIAKISVSLTGFLLENGIRKPVTVSYKSLLSSKIDGRDITPIDGVLSFVPSDFSEGEAIVKTIELPVHADQILEGTEKVSLELFDAKNTYISKSIGIVTIEESEAIIRFTAGSDAVEGKPIAYTLGLFKPDGTAITNKTGSPIKISYRFGFGSAQPNINFDASTKTPLMINDGESTTSLFVKTKEDSFYKDTQSVQLVLFEVNSSNGSVVEFLGNAKTLSANQYINDIGAEVQISKISDHGRGGEMASSLFKITLVKASDGSIVTNCSGGDVKVQFAVDSSSTAVLNKDFVIMSDGGVSIVGGCNGREADVKIICIPGSTASNTNKSIVLGITKVSGPLSAGPLSVSANKNKATVLLLGSKQ